MRGCWLSSKMYKIKLMSVVCSLGDLVRGYTLFGRLPFPFEIAVALAFVDFAKNNKLKASGEIIKPGSIQYLPPR